MGGMITIAFVAAFLYAGKRLFSIKDWGKRKDADSQGPGMKFPPVPK